MKTKILIDKVYCAWLVPVLRCSDGAGGGAGEKVIEEEEEDIVRGVGFCPPTPAGLRG